MAGLWPSGAQGRLSVGVNSWAMAAPSRLNIDEIRSIEVGRRDVAAILDQSRQARGEFEAGREFARRCLDVLDLTSLRVNDTQESTISLCRRARETLPYAVCVYPVFAEVARNELEGTGVRLATVAGGFPHGLSPLNARIREVALCAEVGADEIDVVIRREWAMTSNWARLYDECSRFRDVASDAVLKVILSTGDIASHGAIARAAYVVCCSGADFVKTSSGQDTAPSTIEHGCAVAHALRMFRERRGQAVGLKAAGGIRTRSDAMEWMALAEWIQKGSSRDPLQFRIGSSALLDDLEHCAS